MSFLIEDDDLLEKYNTIWGKVSANIKGDEVIGFYDKEIPKIDSNHTYLAVISLDFVLRKDESSYLQVFLKEGKYIEEKVVRHIRNSFTDFSCCSDESDEE